MLILVRHGESTGNAEGRLLGRIDSPLTERGSAQARSLADAVAGATRLISSPLARARDTAEALGTGLPGRGGRTVDRGRLRRLRRAEARCRPGRGLGAVALGPDLRARRAARAWPPPAPRAAPPARSSSPTRTVRPAGTARWWS